MIGPHADPQPGCLSRASQAAAWMLVAAVVLALPAALWLRALGVVVFSASSVEQIVNARLVESGLLRQALGESFVDQMAANASAGAGLDLARATQDLSPEQRNAMWEILLPTEWVKDQVHQAVAGASDWLQRASAVLDPQLDLVPLKGRLAGGGGAHLVDLIVLSWPACSAQQVEEMAASSAANGEAPLLYCNPPEPFHGLLVNYATASIIQQARQMPDRLSLIAGGSRQAELDRARQQLRRTRAVLDFIWLVPLSLLGIVMALKVRSFAGWMRWWGWPLLLGGLLAIGLAFVQSAMFLAWLQASLARQGLSPALQALIRALVKGVLDAAGGRLAFQGLVMGVLGGGMLISGRLIERPRSAAAPPEASGSDQAMAGPQGEARSSGMFG
jgi:hypothetical protein